jgi:hypothetical protein
VQFVGYDRSPDPALLLGDGGPVERVALDPGTDLGYSLGARRCAGALADDGRLVHRRCERERAPYCHAHTSTWACARCTGDCDLPLENCRREHVVYLAAFAPATFKVGVTKPERLETRLREQGADRAALVEHHPDGRAARRREAALAERITDRVRTPTKVVSLARAVDTAAWEALLADFDPAERFAFDYGLELDDRPVRETLATGTVRGVKGRLLVLDNAGGTYAVDLRALLGHEVNEERSDRDIQSSLGKFG